jgi:hypothetical protein
MHLFRRHCLPRGYGWLWLRTKSRENCPLAIIRSKPNTEVERMCLTTLRWTGCVFLTASVWNGWWLLLITLCTKLRGYVPCNPRWGARRSPVRESGLWDRCLKGISCGRVRWFPAYLKGAKVHIGLCKIHSSNFLRHACPACTNRTTGGRNILDVRLIFFTPAI